MREARPDEALVVAEQDADHSGRRARTAKPPPSRGPVSSSPPKTDTRSCMPSEPVPRAARRCRRPRRRRAPRPRRGRAGSAGGTCARAGPACLSAFVNASCTIRYADRSTPGGSSRLSPSTVTSTGSPASRIFAARTSTCARLGCGASAISSPSSRRTPSSRRISASAAGRGGLDRIDRAARVVGRVVERVTRAACLEDDHAHRVRDDVVELAGDPRPLLGHRRPRTLVALLDEQLAPARGGSESRRRRGTARRR